MELAYIAGPYRSDTINGTVQNIRAAEQVSIKYWKKGYAVICPHKNTALFDGICPDNTWLDGDIEILKRCDVIVMMSNWRSSSGAIKERKVAIEHGLSVIYD